MRVLIVGSKGFMGRHLMQALRERSIEVVGLSSTDGSGIDPETGLLPMQFEVAEGTDVLVYLAQSPRYRNVAEASHVLAVNELSAVRAAEAARRAGVTRLIYVSTGTVYGPSFSPLREDSPLLPMDWYSLSKIHGEQAVAMYRGLLQVCVVRPFGVYGPGQRGRLVPNLMHSIRSGNAIALQGRPGEPADRGGLKISLCYIDDATEILLALIGNGGPEYVNMAGCQAVAIRDLAMELAELMGSRAIFTESPTSRRTDLIADISLLRRSVPGQFTHLSDGLEAVVAAEGREEF